MLRSRSLVPILALAVLAGCGPLASGPSAPAPSPAADAAKSPFKAWSEAVKDTREIEGLFAVHLKRDNTLFLEIQPEQLEMDFGLVMHFNRGVGVYNAHQGLPLSAMQLMRFRRHGDKVYLIHVNPRFTAAEGTPMRTSLEGNVGHSIAAAFKIEAEQDSTKALLLDATSFFVSDYAQVSEQLKFYHGNKPVTLDNDRSFVEGVMGFPRNVEIDAGLTTRTPEHPGAAAAGVSDHRWVPIGVRYSLIALPDEPMRPRIADDRVGNFLDAVRDFSRDREVTPYVRYVNRWRLEKKDHDASISEPVQPIVFYIDRTVPLEYRQYVREGIEGWNKAFEAAGFRNAIVARDAPEDSAWSAEDARYSTVRWTAAHQMGYAIGPSQTDPRTGEILNADVLISSTFVTGWSNEYAQLAGPEGILTRFLEAERLHQHLPPHLAARMCLAEMGKSHEIGLQHAALAALGVLDGTKPMPEEYLGDAIRDLVMHEVGHTLGLRHNFKGSSAIPYERLNDKEFTRRHGLTLSVMDYAATNISPDTAKQGHFVNMEVGSYDMWAIRYAYAPIYAQAAGGPLATTGQPVDTPEEELDGLRKIASLAADPLHSYNTDEDTHLGPMALDPLSNTWDLSSDPLAFARDRALLVERIQPRLEARLISDGDGYQRLRGAVNGMIFERARMLLPVTKKVGGIYFSRDHKGDPGGRVPFRPVSADRQREAVDLIVTQAFSPEAFAFEEDLLNKAAPNRYADWSGGWFTAPIDFPVHANVGAVQRMLLGQLLDNGRFTRMIDNEVRMPEGEDPYTVAELLGTLTGAIWSELGTGARRPRNVNSYRRNLQREHLDQMVRILHDIRPPNAMPAPEDARSLARYQLVGLSRSLRQSLAAGGALDVTTRAHLDESRARIERALEASLSLPPR